MPGPTRGATRLATLLATIAVAVMAAIAPGVAHAEAGEQPVRLSAKVVGQPGPYFDLTLEPGQSRRLHVELGNHGTSPVRARTYAADGSTIINGGFAAALRGSERSGTTGWLDYQTKLLTLHPGQPAVETFTVAVPPGTPPGEYITSVVLENEDPVQGQGALALDQIVRQVVAVAVRVPGPLVPGLAIGGASHTTAADRSLVAVEVSNTGNQRLTPAAELAVHDTSGRELARQDVAMDSFYAGTRTKVEIALAAALAPGDYTVVVTLNDAERGARATAAGLSLTVIEPELVAAPATSIAQQAVDVMRITSARVPGDALPIGLVALAGIVVAGLWLLRSRRTAATRGRHGRGPTRRATAS